MSFGTNPTQTSANTLFGTSLNNTMGGSSGFGSNMQQTPNLFGTPTNPLFSTVGTATGNVGSTFGTATTTASTGFTFGAPQNTSALGLSFGTPAPGSSGFRFGTPATSSGFGSTKPAFGLPTSATTTTSTFPTLGSIASAPPKGLNFGSTSGVSSGFTLGTTTAPTSLGNAGLFPTSGLNTGVTQSLGFGLASTGFGTSAASTYPFSSSPFAKTTASTVLSFGVTTSLPSFGTSLFGTTTTTATSGGLSLFNSSTPFSSSGLQIGATSQPLGFGIGTSSTTLTLTTTTTSAPVGLGGIITSIPKPTSDKAEVAPRDQPLPNEIIQTVDAFNEFVKQQKHHSSDVSRFSVKEFKRITDDIDFLNKLLDDVEKQLQKNRGIAEKLKYDTAKGLQHVEMALRTFDTPPGLQYENIAPLKFFIGLVDNFEKEMHSLKLQIENTDKYVRNMGKSVPLDSNDLVLGMKHLHETFVALAGRLQLIHSQVESQKEYYLNFRKEVLKDDTNVFEQRSTVIHMLDKMNTFNYKPADVASGPSPFNSTLHPSLASQAVMQNQTPATTTMGFGTVQQSSGLFWGQPWMGNLFHNLSGSSNLFGQPSFQFSSSGANNFPLSKPTGTTKRGRD